MSPRLASWVLAVCPLLSGADAEPVKVKVPGHEVEVSVEIPDFQPEKDIPNPGRTLLYGRMANGALISVLWEKNFPFVATEDCPKAFSKEKGFRTFTVDGKACTLYRLETFEAVCQSQFYANLATPDFLFTIHVSRTFRLEDAAGEGELKRSEVEPIARSLKVSGTADRSQFDFPAEVYAFRDQAARPKPGQLEWVKKQCNARPDDWVAHFYLGELAYNERVVEVASRGYERSAELLGQRVDRSAGETRALFVALDSRAACLEGQKKFDRALPVCREILKLAETAASDHARPFREAALFRLACCHAMTSRPEEAMKYLRQALEARPEWKERAKRDDWLASLRTKTEFKTLVGD